MADSKAGSKSFFITPLAMASYVYAATPQKDGKYSATFVFAPDLIADEKEQKLLAVLKQAAITKVKEKWTDKAEALLRSDKFHKGFRGDVELKGYPEGSVFISARSQNQPGCVYSYLDPATNKPAKIAPEDIKKVLYPGAIVRGLVSVFTFDKEGNKGVSFGLTGIQFVKDGPRIDGRVAAEDAFDADMSAAPASLEDLL